MPIIRNLVLAVGAILMIPTPPEATQDPAKSAIATPEFLTAARETVADLGGFCLRQPGVCETAQYVAGKLELKAKYGVRILYEWANEAGSDAPLPGPENADAAEDLLTGSVRLAGTPRVPAGGTLAVGDLLPHWRAPRRAADG